MALTENYSRHRPSGTSAIFTSRCLSSVLSGNAVQIHSIAVQGGAAGSRQSGLNPSLPQARNLAPPARRQSQQAWLDDLSFDDHDELDDMHAGQWQRQKARPQEVTTISHQQPSAVSVVFDNNECGEMVSVHGIVGCHDRLSHSSPSHKCSLSWDDALSSITKDELCNMQPGQWQQQRARPQLSSTSFWTMHPAALLKMSWLCCKRDMTSATEPGPSKPVANLRFNASPYMRSHQSHEIPCLHVFCSCLTS